jgi:hypothetical protein
MSEEASYAVQRSDRSHQLSKLNPVSRERNGARKRKKAKKKVGPGKTQQEEESLQDDKDKSEGEKDDDDKHSIDCLA